MGRGGNAVVGPGMVDVRYWFAEGTKTALVVGITVCRRPRMTGAMATLVGKSQKRIACITRADTEEGLYSNWSFRINCTTGPVPRLVAFKLKGGETHR